MANSKETSLPYFRQSAGHTMLILVLLLLVLLFAIINIGVGAVTATPMQVLSILLSPLGCGEFRPVSSIQETVVWNIRLPRALLGILVGGCLGVSGAALQGLFRNPLAEPGFVGVSSGAAFGAVVATYWGDLFSSSTGIYLTPTSAFIFGSAVSFLVYYLATREGHTNTAMMLLGGVAINSILAACIGILIYIGDDQQMRAIMFWMFGSLSGALWKTLVPAFPFLLAPLIASWFWTRPLNLYLLGEREAGHVGVNVQRLKTMILLFVALGVGSAVALSGMIGFVGLAAPHLLRLIAGPDHRLLLPASALLGGVLLSAADLIARTTVAPAELPIGLLTALLGGPFFLYLLIRYQRESR